MKNIVKSKSAAGLEVTILPDNSYELNLVILKKEKSTLVTEIQKEKVTSFEVAARIIGTRPLIVIINGKGVIHKKIRIHENDTPTALLNKVLPNTNLDEFIIQETPIYSTEVFISIIRSKTLTEIVEELVKNKITSVAGCFLGPFVVNDILPLIGKDVINNENIIIGNYQLQIREQQITEITSAGLTGEKNILVGDTIVPQGLLVAFGGALTWFTGNENGTCNSDLIKVLKEEFRQKQKYELRGWTVMAAIFIVLMINYFIFNNYWSKNNEMSSQLVLMQSALQRYDTLKTEFTQKKEFLEQNGLLESSRTSYYADRLAIDLPASIQWTSVNIHPLKKKKTGDESETLQFENKMITISGNCQRSTELNNWMKEIKKENWVNDITLINYKQDNAKENGVFLIEIQSK
ncbi:MAG: hypothetical protein ACT4ON_01515 [Bacteroidota bacterium]